MAILVKIREMNPDYFGYVAETDTLSWTGVLSYDTHFFVLNPTALSGLFGANKNSTLSNANFLSFQQTFNSDISIGGLINFADINWASGGWTVGNKRAFKQELRTFFANHLNNPSLNPTLGNVSVYLVQTTINGLSYTLAYATCSKLGEINYWGNSSDGDLNTTGNVTLNSVQDGDVVVKNYTSLTINSGHTLTVANRCKGLVIYVNGDCTINGNLNMDLKGAAVDPVAAGVSANGLRFTRFKSGSSQTLAASDLAGCGTSLINSEGNQLGTSGDGIIFQIQRGGAGGGGGGSQGYTNGGSGANGSTGQSGGGGGGAGVDLGGGNGASGTCFVGGSGGGGGGYYSGGGSASANGGAGGNGGSPHPNNVSGGGAGNPPGTGYVGSSGVVSNSPGGGGGFLALFVRGNLTIGASGVISSQGSRGGNCTAYIHRSGGGGGAGGGNIIIAHAGKLTNNGTLTAAGGAGGIGNGGSVSNNNGGAGGNGSVQGPTLIDE